MGLDLNPFGSESGAGDVAEKRTLQLMLGCAPDQSQIHYTSFNTSLHISQSFKGEVKVY